MNNGRFIKILNDTAASYSGIIYADNTQLDTDVPSGDSREDSPYGWILKLAAALGLSAVGAALLNRYLNDKKMLECLKLMKTHLSIIAPNYGTGGGVFNTLFQRVFGFQSRYLQEQLSGMSVVDITKKFKQLFDLIKTDGMRLIEGQINGLRPDPADGDRAKERLEELQKKLRNCIELLPRLAKDLIKETLIKAFPNLTQPITDAIKYAIDRYLNDGNMFNFAVTVATAAGTGLATSGLISVVTELFAEGFVAEFGIGYTVVVALVGALLVVLSGFFAAGGTAAGIAAWWASTAGSAMTTAVTAAGIITNQQGIIDRLRQIAEQIARQVVPGT